MMFLRSSERHGTEAFPWLPVDGGYIKPQHYSFPSGDWLTLSREVKPWDLARLGNDWRISTAAVFAGA